MHEDPNNLRVLIKEQEHTLGPELRDALLRLRAGKKTDSISLDENNRMWYHPFVTAAMRKAGIRPPLSEIVKRGTVAPMPVCAATSYFLKVCCVETSVH